MNTSRFVRQCIVLALAAVILGAAGHASAAALPAQEATPQQKAEFRKLLRERDQLHRELQQLDRRATAAIKRGEEPVALYAEQVNVEDRLDLVLLRLEMMATRYELAIPALPGEKNLDDGAPAPAGIDQRIDRVFARGRSRALHSMQGDCAFFLGSLNFERFLALDE